MLSAISSSGTQDWACVIGKGSWGSSEQSASPSVGPDGSIYVCSLDGRLYSLSPSGSTNWIFLFDNNIFSPNPSFCSPAIGNDGTIYVGTDAMKVHAITPNGLQRWAYSVAGGFVESTPAIDQTGNIYFGATGNAGVYCLNSEGIKIWSRSGTGTSGSAAIAADGTVYVTSYSAQKLFAYSLAGSNLWSFTFAGMSFSSPIIAADGTIYAGGGAKLYAIVGTAPPLNSPWPMFRRNAFGQARAIQRAIQTIRPLADGNAELRLRGETGRVYQVEASTNLMGWGAITSFSFTTPTNSFVDLTATNFEHRYYRLSVSQ